MKLNYDKLVVKQKVEIFEAISGIETKNRYKILSTGGTEVLSAYEKSNWFARVVLKRMRALSIVFLNKNTEFMRVDKKFAFFFPKFELFDSNKRLIAKVKTKFGITSKLEVYDKNNRLVFYCKNKMMSPWTFKISKRKSDNNFIGLIKKKWSGFGKEIFTDTDNFSVDFKNISDEDDKKIVLALSLIIDLFVFDRK